MDTTIVLRTLKSEGKGESKQRDGCTPINLFLIGVKVLQVQYITRYVNKQRC